ncbi:MAG: ChaN family lipoprotein [Brumimicrobium sp.]|nr:ChaN family lipoprotein [Brumimicrobium sp.]
MIRFLCGLFILAGFSTQLIAQQIKAYQIYNSRGKKVSFEKMSADLRKQNIILFGELHNNPISHWMQLELIKSLHKQGSIVLGAEMFERDDQKLLEAYLEGKIEEREFDSLAGLWINYETDYKPLIEYAKRNHLNFEATNIPRRFANMVYKEGFTSLDSLSENEKKWIAPLPIAYNPELPGYKEMLNMMPGHSNENLPKAQAIKDATMAYFIYQGFKKQQASESTFLHFNGTYHSKNYEGIYWYLKEIDTSLKVATIHTVLQGDVMRLEKEHYGAADYILVVDEDMTTTY